MERSYDRELDGYVEKHHIVPRCMGGDDKPRNIVILTPEEHYTAHKLLIKIYPENRNLLSAVMLMSGRRKSKTTNKIFGWLRRRASEMGKSKVISEDLRKRFSEAHKGRKHSEETKRKMSLARKGRKHSDETKRKMSKSAKGKKFSDEHCVNMSLVRMGKKASDETKIKMSISKQGFIPWNSPKKRNIDKKVEH